MKNHRPNTLIAAAILGLCASAGAQDMPGLGAPGSDPIVITGKISFIPLPQSKSKESKPFDPNPDIIPSMKAKVARFQALANSYMGGDGGNNGTFQSGEDVVSVQTGNALQKTCMTNLASNTNTLPATGAVTPSGNAIGPAANAMGPAGRYGPAAAANQIAILRGDLITICN